MGVLAVMLAIIDWVIFGVTASLVQDKRFSLRTLLITMSLLAMMLGLLQLLPNIHAK